MPEKVVYLGDGVYAKAGEDGTLILMANDHKNPTDKIYMEPEVLFAFLKFVESLRKVSS